MRLLLADDHPIFGTLIGQTFQDHGDIVVQPVTDPCTALAMRERADCDVCVIGLGVTPLSELLPALGTGSGQRSPAVVVLLSAADGTLVEQAREMPVNAVGTKEDDFDGIRALVDEAVRRKRASMSQAALSPGARAALGGPRTHPAGTFMTPRERQILQLLAAGKDTTTMARDMGVRVTTVRTHVASLMRKLGAHTRLEAVATARRLGLAGAHPPVDDHRLDRHRASPDPGPGRDS